MDQLLAHLVGDYLFQNKWISVKKHENFLVALLHGALYTLPFVLITQVPITLLIIGLTHAVIDYFSIGSWVMWLKDQFAPKKFRSSVDEVMKSTNDPNNWLMFSLRIVNDNALHLLINFFAIKYFG